MLIIQEERQEHFVISIQDLDSRVANTNWSSLPIKKWRGVFFESASFFFFLFLPFCLCQSELSVFAWKKAKRGEESLLGLQRELEKQERKRTAKHKLNTIQWFDSS